MMSINGESGGNAWEKTTVQTAEIVAMPSMASAFAVQSAPAALLIGRAWSFNLSPRTLCRRSIWRKAFSHRGRR